MWILAKTHITLLATYSPNTMPTLYIIATPIGNLKDITLRALDVLRSVDIVVCEDTRVTRNLLSHYEIIKPLMSYHQHSTGNSVKKIHDLLKEGKDVGYVSDAGTPGIQDPGGCLVSEILRLSESKEGKEEIDVVPIPGVSAVTALLSVSGLPADSFVFFGFVPKKRGKKRVIQEISDSNRTAIFYESGHRIIKTLEELGNLGEREVVVGRELTKKFETVYRGTISSVINQLEKSSTKGEFAIVVEAQSQKTKD